MEKYICVLLQIGFIMDYDWKWELSDKFCWAFPVLNFKEMSGTIYEKHGEVQS
jgi:hypothetical protein